MTHTLQVASGSIIGRGHVGSGNLLMGGNNQDAFRIHLEDDCSIFVVSDGCGSAFGSEVGAKLSCELMVSALKKEWQRVGSHLTHTQSDPLPNSFWDRALMRMLAPIAVLTEAIAQTPKEQEALLGSYFLSTILGALHTRAGTWVFSTGGGDGVYAVNGEVVELAPQEGNEPVYPVYRLVRSKFSEKPWLSSLKVQRFIPPGELHSLLIGTDGVSELIQRAEAAIPGSSELVGDLRTLWEKDEFFTDETALPRFLRRVNSEVTRVSRNEDTARLTRERGLLSDDTTLVVVRREPTP